MTVTDIPSAVDSLLACESNRVSRSRITEEWDGLDLATAYTVQRELVAAKVARQGDAVIGTKLGLTSAAKQQRMGISSPLTAVLLKSYVLKQDALLPLDRLIQPRVEPELVFTMKKKLQGPGVTTEDVLDAIDKVYAGFEVIDSRYHDYSFALPDVVADNASSALLIVGEVGIDAANIDLINEHVAISKNGEFVYEATGEAVQGNPAYALALAVNELAERGQFVDAGEVVLTGGMTDAVPIGPGDTITAVFSNLGALSVTATS
jgi:2-oxo-3-hexenedioate decarboxylase